MSAVAGSALPDDIGVAQAALGLRAHASAPREARAFAQVTLRQWGAEDDVTESAVMVVSELATNALLHACGGSRGERTEAITLNLLLRPRILDIKVRDGSPTIPVPRRTGGDEESGRGLLIVEALAESWTCFPDAAGGKWVVASLPRPRLGRLR